MEFGTLAEPPATRYALDDDSDDENLSPREMIKVQASIDGDVSFATTIIIGLQGAGYAITSAIKAPVAKLKVEGAAKLEFAIHKQEDKAIIPIPYLVERHSSSSVTVSPANDEIVTTSPAQSALLEHHIAHAISKAIGSTNAKLLIIDSFQSFEYIGDKDIPVRVLSTTKSTIPPFEGPNLATELGAALLSNATRNQKEATLLLASSIRSSGIAYTDPVVTREVLRHVPLKVDEKSILAAVSKQWDRLEQNNRLYM